MNVENIRGQGYDGISNMTSERVGVQAQIKELFPLATYIHCSSHQLNKSSYNSFMYLSRSSCMMTASARTGSATFVAKWVTSLECAGIRADLPSRARKVETREAIVKQAVTTTEQKTHRRKCILFHLKEKGHPNIMVTLDLKNSSLRMEGD